MSDKIKKLIRRTKPAIPSAAVIKAMKRKSPGWCRSLIGRYPEFGVVSCTALKDGFKLINAHTMDAEVEVAGFCVLHGLKEGLVFKPQAKTISLKRLLTPGKETSYEACEDAADRYLSRYFKFERANLTKDERWRVRRKMETYKSILERALKDKRDPLLGGLHYILFRPAGWLLLGTGDEKSLAKMVRESFGQGVVNQMRQARSLSTAMVEKLVARKNQVEYEQKQKEKKAKAEKMAAANP